MENQPTAPMIANPGAFPAKVAKIIDDYKLVINRGKEHGIREGQKILVYNGDGEEIIDPETGELLGTLELVKGQGRVFYVNEKYSLVESLNEPSEDKINKLRKKILAIEAAPKIYEQLERALNSAIFPNRDAQKKLLQNEIEYLQRNKFMPFDNPQVGDSVKPI